MNQWRSLTTFIIDLNSTTYISMYEIPTKWIKSGPWLKLRTLLPRRIKYCFCTYKNNLKTRVFIGCCYFIGVKILVILCQFNWKWYLWRRNCVQFQNVCLLDFLSIYFILSSIISKLVPFFIGVMFIFLKH